MSRILGNKQSLYITDNRNFISTICVTQIYDVNTKIHRSHFVAVISKVILLTEVCSEHLLCLTELILGSDVHFSVNSPLALHAILESIYELNETFPNIRVSLLRGWSAGFHRISLQNYKLK